MELQTEEVLQHLNQRIVQLEQQMADVVARIDNLESDVESQPVSDHLLALERGMDAAGF